MQWFNARTVVLDPEAEDFVRGAEAAHPRFEAQWRGADWLLARSPEIGVPRDSREPMKYLVHVVPENSLATTHELWILYSYDADEVTVHRARFLDGHNLNAL